MRGDFYKKSSGLWRGVGAVACRNSGWGLSDRCLAQLSPSLAAGIVPDSVSQTDGVGRRAGSAGLVGASAGSFMVRVGWDCQCAGIDIYIYRILDRRVW